MMKSGNSILKSQKKQSPLRRCQRQQSGFSLFIVIIAMLVIAFLVVSTLQSTNMEARSSANDADRKVAMANAQAALNIAETKIAELVNVNGDVLFSKACSGGLCVAKDLPATVIDNAPYTISSTAKITVNCDGSCSSLSDVWQRPDVLTVNGTSQTTDPSIPVMSGTTYQNARYVIEFLGTQVDGSTTYYMFRVTAKSWGTNSNTQVLLQSYEKAAF